MEREHEVPHQVLPWDLSERRSGSSTIHTRFPVLHASVSIDALSPGHDEGVGERQVGEVRIRPPPGAH